MSELPSKKVTVSRRWLEPVPKSLWPKRRHHRWIVRWYSVGPDDKTKRPGKMFDTKDEAEAFAREKASVFDKDEHARFEPKKITLGEFIVEYVTHRIGE